MGYRPITDIWFLTRAKLKDGRKYYGAYLGGFPERARWLLGASINDPVLHICGGMARYYPYKGGFGENDKTMDLDPITKPDFLQDARDPFPVDSWRAILIDPPYSESDADHYGPGREKYPKPNILIKNALSVLRAGGRVGLIHYTLPAQPKDAKFIAAIGIICGFNNRIRCFSVFEKLQSDDRIIADNLSGGDVPAPEGSGCHVLAGNGLEIRSSVKPTATATPTPPAQNISPVPKGKQKPACA